MLSGNPDTFAIWCDAVDSWSTAGFKNGCFGYFIGGKLIWSNRSTLGVDLHGLSMLHCMKNAVEDIDLFNLPVGVAYQELCKRAFPSTDSSVENSDFSYFVSVESLSDDGHNVFLIECETHAKLIYGFNNDPESLCEITLRRGEFQEVAREAVAKFGA
jgi:hypothetical protein